MTKSSKYTCSAKVMPGHTYDLISSLLIYDPNTGILRWKTRFNAQIRPDLIAGGPNTASKYIMISIQRRRYQAHRLAWLLTHKEWPNREIDHINGDRMDNRIINLRLCIGGGNAHNAPLRKDNKTGVKGICFHKKTKNWAAYIAVNNVRQYKEFKSLEEAEAWVKSKRPNLHGEFARHE